MGALRNKVRKTAPPAVRERSDKAPEVQQTMLDNNVALLQKWLLETFPDTPIADLGGQYGIYDKVTHQAVENAANVMRMKGVAADGRETGAYPGGAIAAIEALAASRYEQIKKEPQIILNTVLRLQQVYPKISSTPEKKRYSPDYKINIDGKDMMLPLALVYNQGYPMYQAILEQNGLIKMSAPLADRLERLASIYQQIMASLPQGDPDYVTIRNVVTLADTDLRNAWNKVAGGGGTGSGELFIAALTGIVPDLNKASDEQKTQIINHIFYTYPTARKFIEGPPPTLASRLLNSNEFMNVNHSLAETVVTKLREWGLRR
jgi:hypothetical protein